MHRNYEVQYVHAKVTQQKLDFFLAEHAPNFADRRQCPAATKKREIETKERGTHQTTKR